MRFSIHRQSKLKHEFLNGANICIKKQTMIVKHDWTVSFEKCNHSVEENINHLAKSQIYFSWGIWQWIITYKISFLKAKTQ